MFKYLVEMKDLSLLYLRSDNFELIGYSHADFAGSRLSIQHYRTKHIEVRHHFIGDHIDKGDIFLDFGPTNMQLADIFS